MVGEKIDAKCQREPLHSLTGQNNFGLTKVDRKNLSETNSKLKGLI